MINKDFLKLFIPPILTKVALRLKPTKETIIVNPSNVRDIQKTNDSLVVIGNGPSLNETMNVSFEKIVTKDCIVVNGFCKTDYYERVRPPLYLLADPSFFVDNYEASDRVDAKGVLDNLIKKTAWDVYLIVPYSAKNSPFIKIVQSNSFIHVIYYNDKNLISDSNRTKFELWDENLIAPPAQTCLNTCIWLGIFQRYKCIYLIGADTSWMELLHVDQETNQVYTIETHFYEKKKIYLYDESKDGVPQKLHQELDCISRALACYWELRNYANYAGVKVYNSSTYSLIDAFERKKTID